MTEHEGVGWNDGVIHDYDRELRRPSAARDTPVRHPAVGHRRRAGAVRRRSHPACVPGPTGGRGHPARHARGTRWATPGRGILTTTVHSHYYHPRRLRTLNHVVAGSVPRLSEPAPVTGRRGRGSDYMKTETAIQHIEITPGVCGGRRSCRRGRRRPPTGLCNPAAWRTATNTWCTVPCTSGVRSRLARKGESSAAT